jgi:hypothetical protein
MRLQRLWGLDAKRSPVDPHKNGTGNGGDGFAAAHFSLDLGASLIEFLGDGANRNGLS